MRYSEFRTMMTALEKYHKDATVGVIEGKKIKKELDLRYKWLLSANSCRRAWLAQLVRSLPSDHMVPSSILALPRFEYLCDQLLFCLS